jgi:cytosine/adenosine deaminase-related metal-dependent hydrolase
VVAVGDIAGAAGGRPCFEPLRVLRESPLLGVSYLEFFGIGNRLEMAMARLGETVARLAAMNGEGIGRVLGGLQPHAPYSVDLRLYLAATELAQEHDLRVSTHLAETLDEREFVERGTGRLREFLEGLGLWCEGVLEGIGKGLHPVEHLMPVLEQSRFVVAHVNDCDDAAIEGLARTVTSVAYCPRASAYFGAEGAMGPHRYREMLDAGVNVCLGRTRSSTCRRVPRMFQRAACRCWMRRGCCFGGMERMRRCCWGC